MSTYTRIVFLIDVVFFYIDLINWKVMFLVSLVLAVIITTSIEHYLILAMGS